MSLFIFKKDSTTSNKQKIMKKSLLLVPAFALAFGLNSCKKDDTAESGEITSVSTKYKAFVMKHSATWCGPCGTYAYPAVHDLLEQQGDNVTCIYIQDGDDLVSTANIPAGQSVLADHWGFGLPGSAVNAGPETYPSLSALNTQVNTALNANRSAKAGIGISHVVEAAGVKVTAKVVAFSDLPSGTYSLALYLTEDNMMEHQNGLTATEVEFDHVLVGIADGKAFGTTLFSTATKGQKFDKEVTIPISGAVRNRANLRVVAVLWKLDANGEPVDVINSNVY